MCIRDRVEVAVVPPGASMLGGPAVDEAAVETWRSSPAAAELAVVQPRASMLGGPAAEVAVVPPRASTLGGPATEVASLSPVGLAVETVRPPSESRKRRHDESSDSDGERWAAEKRRRTSRFESAFASADPASPPDTTPSPPETTATPSPPSSAPPSSSLNPPTPLSALAEFLDFSD